MKKVLAFTAALALLLTPVLADAHPGRTDSDGGHYCWTNCGKWGLEYGEYHYHDGGGSDSYTYTEPVYVAPQYTVLQYGLELDTFVGLSDAIALARQYDHTHVYSITTGDLMWDNYPTQVFQYSKYIGDFGSRTSAINYAKQFDHTKVIGTETGELYWHNYPYNVFQYDKYLTTFATSDAAINYAEQFDHSSVVNTLNNEETWSNYYEYEDEYDYYYEY